MTSFLQDLWELIRGVLFYKQPTDVAELAGWRAVDLARLEGAPGIDVRGLDRLIGAGLQHRIYAYEAQDGPRVLKLISPNRLLRFPTEAEAEEDLRLVARYFEPYKIEPSGVVPLRDGTYAVLQRRLERFHGLTRADLQDSILREQFLDLVRRNLALRREAGRSLDFLGREGQRKCRAALVGLGPAPAISNLAAEMQADGSSILRVVDGDLENFRPGAKSLRDRRSALAARLAFEVNRFFIRHFFGIDIARAIPAGPSDR